MSWQTVPAYGRRIERVDVVYDDGSIARVRWDSGRNVLVFGEAFAAPWYLRIASWIFIALDPRAKGIAFEGRCSP